MAFQKGHPNYHKKRSEEETVGDVVSEQAPPIEAPDDSSALLASLGQAFLAMSQDKAGQQQAIVRVTEVLSKLSAKDYPALMDNPEVQRFIDGMVKQKAESSEDPPGTVYNRGTLAEHKKPWTWRDIKNEKMITFTPNRSMLLVWNGLVANIFADQENTIPACFYGIYVESQRGTKFATEHAEWLFRHRDAPTHPDMVTAEGVVARATGDTGSYLPGAGPHSGAAAVAEEGEGGESGETA